MLGEYAIEGAEGADFEVAKETLAVRVACVGVVQGYIYCHDLATAQVVARALRQQERLRGYGPLLAKK